MGLYTLKQVKKKYKGQPEKFKALLDGLDRNGKLIRGEQESKMVATMRKNGYKDFDIQEQLALDHSKISRAEYAKLHPQPKSRTPLKQQGYLENVGRNLAPQTYANIVDKQPGSVPAAVLSDLSSLPGRGVMALGKAYMPFVGAEFGTKANTFSEAMQNPGTDLVSEIVTDPANIPLALVSGGVGPLMRSLKVGRTAIPELARVAADPKVRAASKGLLLRTLGNPVTQRAGKAAAKVLSPVVKTAEKTLSKTPTWIKKAAIIGPAQGYALGTTRLVQSKNDKKISPQVAKKEALMASITPFIFGAAGAGVQKLGKAGLRSTAASRVAREIATAVKKGKPSVLDYISDTYPLAAQKGNPTYLKGSTIYGITKDARAKMGVLEDKLGQAVREYKRPVALLSTFFKEVKDKIMASKKSYHGTSYSGEEDKALKILKKLEAEILAKKSKLGQEGVLAKDLLALKRSLSKRAETLYARIAQGVTIKPGSILKAQVERDLSGGMMQALSAKPFRKAIEMMEAKNVKGIPSVFKRYIKTGDKIKAINREYSKLLKIDQLMDALTSKGRGLPSSLYSTIHNLFAGSTGPLMATKTGMGMQRATTPAVADVTLSSIKAVPDFTGMAPKFLKSFLNVPDNNKGDK